MIARLNLTLVSIFMTSLHRTVHVSIIVCILLWGGLGQNTNAETLRIAVASNFNHTFRTIKAEFEQVSQHRIRTSYGSTGQLYAQILHGAPFDIFLAADTDRPQKLIRKDLAQASNSLLYARGRLALWAPNQNANMLLQQNNSTKSRLAIANPKLAPYGAASKALLKTLGLWQMWEKQLLRAQNINQAYQFVATGNATLGFISYSQLIHARRTRHNSLVEIDPQHLWTPALESYPPILQQAVILKKSNDLLAAKEFLNFLSSEEIKALIKSHGYSLSFDLDTDSRPSSDSQI